MSMLQGHYEGLDLHPHTRGYEALHHAPCFWTMRALQPYWFSLLGTASRREAWQGVKALR